MFLILRAIGERSYSLHDCASAAAFRDRVAVLWRSSKAALRDDVRQCAAGCGAQPLPTIPEFAELLTARRVPLRIDRWLRFAYRTEAGQWMWTWMFRFARTPAGQLTSLRAWLQQLLIYAPPLHVIDHAGRPVRGSKEAVCQWCPPGDTGASLEGA